MGGKKKNHSSPFVCSWEEQRRIMPMCVEAALTLALSGSDYVTLQIIYLDTVRM